MKCYTMFVMLKCWFLIMIWILTTVGQVEGDYGLLLAVDNSTHEASLCCSYMRFETAQHLPNNKEAAPFVQLLDLTLWEGCDGFPPLQVDDIIGKVIMVNWRQCSVNVKGFFIEFLGGVGVIVVTPVLSQELLPSNETEQYIFTIPLSIITEDSYDRIQDLGRDVMVKFYVPESGWYLNFSFIALWVIAITGVAFGAIYTSDARNNIQRYSNGYQNESRYQLLTNGVSIQNASTGCENDPKASIICSSCIAAMYFLLIIGPMLLLYFFFGSVVYMFIGLFCVASAISVYWIFQPFVHFVHCGSYRLNFRFLKQCNCIIEIREIFLFICCVALSVTWCIFRHARFIWILQDFLGIAVCIAFIAVNRINNLKFCTVILVAFFVYDVFFVFVTPLFTSDGRSVMEKIVVGGNDEQAVSPNEQIPTILKIPYYSLDPLAICFDSSFLLGFGDIMIPGLLVSLCYDFGQKTNTTKIYFPVVLIGYGFGMIITDVFLTLMKMIQPALLYLVPSTLILVVVTSCIRKEFRYLWTGHPQVSDGGYKYDEVIQMDS